MHGTASLNPPSAETRVLCNWKDGAAINYLDFADRLRFDSRFVFDDESMKFLRYLSQAAKARLIPVSADSLIYRAQVNRFGDWKEVIPDCDPVYVALSQERMTPDPHLVGDGRLNPRGIAYLYAADSPETSIAEVRPAKGAFVTVATLKASAALRVIDLCPRGSADDRTWHEIDFCISIPFEKVDSWRSYLPTQCIAEYLKMQGYSGIRYRSTMRSAGYNVALFNVDDAEFVQRHLYEVNDVIFTAQRIEDVRREV